MKKAFLSIIVSALFCTAASAQQINTHEASIGFGFAPVGQSNQVTRTTGTFGSLASIYEPLASQVRISGVTTAEVYRRVGKRWSTSIYVSYCRLMSSASLQSYTHDGITTVSSSSEKINGNAFALMNMWRYEYVLKPKFRLYSAVGFGYGYYSKFNVGTSGRYDVTNVEYQLVPVGLTFGKDIFVLCETGLGSQYVGGRVGVGYRF